MLHRARGLGVPFDGMAGPNNAITDVPGVEVGHTTLISDIEARPDGTGRVRTGVTVIHPNGRFGRGGVAAGRAMLNGTGEWTGMHFIDEVGRLYGPIALTGTGNLGVVHSSLVKWSSLLNYDSEDERYMRLLAVVGETLDAYLHDVHNFQLSPEEVFSALDNAKSGPVAEGNVGGGTGMMAYEFKGGIGTSSRIVSTSEASYVVGALLQANHARRSDLKISGVNVGMEITNLMPHQLNTNGGTTSLQPNENLKNSLLVVLATDAPLLAHQLNRLARRAALGIGRTGAIARNLSGELMLAFSTTGGVKTGCIDDFDSNTMNALFAAAVQVVEEALVNQLVASSDMIGNGNLAVHALPHEALRQILGKYNLLQNDA